MAETIPTPALGLLAFIASYEAPKGYDTVYANRMAQMPKPLTSMSLNEVIADGPRRTKLFGSSACGRYQFMTATLKDLQKTLVLMGNDLFTPELQDRLGYELLKRRGYIKFALGAMSVQAFGLGLAQEWASFPVLAAVKGGSRNVVRGQSYYAGDGLNKALVKPDAVEAALARVLAASRAEPSPPALPAPSPVPAVPAAVVVPVPTVPGAVVAIPTPEARNLWQRVADRLRAAFPPNKG
jgi:hypothetical protein